MTPRKMAGNKPRRTPRRKDTPPESIRDLARDIAIPPTTRAQLHVGNASGIASEAPTASQDARAENAKPVGSIDAANALDAANAALRVGEPQGAAEKVKRGPKLYSAKQAKYQQAWVFKELRAGRLDPQTANAMTNALRNFGSLLAADVLKQLQDLRERDETEADLA